MFSLRSYPNVHTEFLAKAKELGAIKPQLSSRRGSYGMGNEITLRGGVKPLVGDSYRVVLARGWISAFNGCCGIAIAYHAKVAEPKWLPWIFEIRERLAQANNIGLLIQTDVKGDSETEFDDFAKLSKWPELFEFYNPNSGNKVTIWGKVIPERED